MYISKLAHMGMFIPWIILIRFSGYPLKKCVHAHSILLCLSFSGVFKTVEEETIFERSLASAKFLIKPSSAEFWILLIQGQFRMLLFLVCKDYRKRALVRISCIERPIRRSP